MEELKLIEETQHGGEKHELSPSLLVIFCALDWMSVSLLGGWVAQFR